MKKNLMSILSIGYGKMGKQLVDSLIQKGNNVSVVTKSNIPQNLNENRKIHFLGLPKVIGLYDMILFNTKQDQIHEVLSLLPSDITNSETIFVSTLPGITREFYYDFLGKNTKVA